MVEGENTHQMSDGAPRSYVCGFMFDQLKERVTLILKNRPAWQAGKFNGVGGKIEPGEGPLDAMIREFNEEAGVFFPYWRQFAKLELSRGGEIYLFTAVSDAARSVRTMTDEPVGLFPINALYEAQTMPNVRWLVPMALSFEMGEKSSAFVIKEIEETQT